jgi:hypothetical protein
VVSTLRSEYVWVATESIKIQMLTPG